jgi:hypothetical protein
VDIHQRTYREKLAEHLIKNLTKRRMEASYAPTAAQARDEVLAMIPAGSSVSRCGSMSLVEMGLWEELAKKEGVEVIDPFVPGLSPEQRYDLLRRGLLADFMIASTNALTLDGKIVNLDGMGNRVAAMCFGPNKVILVVGLNKVAPDLETALARVKHHAAPINAIRLKRATPCGETGLCADCRSPERICNMWSIIEGHLLENRIHVKLVGEDLGY